MREAVYDENPGYEAFAVAMSNGAYTLRIQMNGRALERSYRPADDEERSALAESLWDGVAVVVTVEADVFLRGVRPRPRGPGDIR